jgi:uncharacterized protein (DUF427 family)
MKRIAPGPGQESVWDYPRPPRIELCKLRIRVEFNGEPVCDTMRAYRVLETSHPPTYYVPRSDVRMEFLKPSLRRSFCEFKGDAGYFDLTVGERSSRDAAWSYSQPTPAFAVLRDYLGFYVSRTDACFVGDEQAQPQQGGLYAGWITSHIVGPFKGAPGTNYW